MIKLEPLPPEKPMPPGINIANTESSREMSDVSPNQYERSLNETMLSNLLKEQSQEHVMV